jgi:hypothetical protein
VLDRESISHQNDNCGIKSALPSEPLTPVNDV